jgi:hypothetical protein
VCDRCAITYLVNPAFTSHKSGSGQNSRSVAAEFL